MLHQRSEPALDAQQHICATVRLLMKCKRLRSFAALVRPSYVVLQQRVISHQIGAAVR